VEVPCRSARRSTSQAPAWLCFGDGSWPKNSSYLLAWRTPSSWGGFDVGVIDGVCLGIQPAGYFDLLTGKILYACLIIQTVNFIPGAKDPLPTSPDASFSARGRVGAHCMPRDHFFMRTAKEWTFMAHCVSEISPWNLDFEEPALAKAIVPSMNNMILSDFISTPSHSSSDQSRAK